MRRTSAYTIIFAFLATVLILMWSKDLQLTAEPISTYAFQVSQEDTSIGSFVNLYKVAAKELGWAETLKVMPYLLSYFFGGSTGLFVSLFVSAFVLLSLVHSLANKLSTPKVAAITQLIFALSPFLIGYPYDVLSPFSPSFIALVAIHLALIAPNWRPLLRKLSWVPLSALVIMIHILTDWGLWLLVFIIVNTLNTSLTASRVVILLSVIGLIVVVHTASNSPLLSMYPETPLRTILLAPNAVQIGYSDIIPKELTFQLPGNNPPLLLLFLTSPLLWFSQKSSAFKFMALWLATCIVCTFELLLSSPAVGLSFLLFPICFISAYFFYTTSHTDASIIIFVLIFLLFSLASSLEPTSNFVIVSTKFPGWNTEMLLRDIGQISGGVLTILIFMYLALKNTAYSRLCQLLSGVILFLFGISQITLMQLLQGQ